VDVSQLEELAQEVQWYCKQEMTQDVLKLLIAKEKYSMFEEKIKSFPSFDGMGVQVMWKVFGQGAIFERL